MNTPITVRHHTTNEDQYARAVAVSKRVRWDIDRDVIRGRTFDVAHKFLPDGLSLANKLPFLTAPEQKLVSQIQGRTYANMFGLVERFVNAKVLELSRRHALADQVALEALVRFSDEELKHQELFRRIERLVADVMPAGYRFVLDPGEVAKVVLSKPTWSVLALTCLIELYSQTHYKESIGPNDQLSDLFRDVFRFHWIEESQHAIIDELEWVAEDGGLEPEQRDKGVTGLIELVGALDGLLRMQADADAGCFREQSGRAFTPAERHAIDALFLEAYRYQYILSGIEKTRFVKILRDMLDDAQFERIVRALAALS